MSKLRLGLIGAGVIGKRHLAAIPEVAGVELVGIADPSPDAAKIANAMAAPHFSDTDELLAAARPDGVIIATPTEHHLVPTSLCLRAGAHVLVEKPIMATLEEAEQIIELSEETGLQVLVGHHRRYYDLVMKAKTIVESGQLGQLVAVSGQWNLRKHVSYYEPAWRREWHAGPVLTNLIHDMDLLRFIAGEITTISAEISNSVMHVEKEDAAALIMRFANGALGSFVLSDQTHSPWGWEQGTGENQIVPRSAQNSMRFMGTEGALEFPNLKLWRSEGVSSWKTPLQFEDLATELKDPYISQIAHFAAVIRKEETPHITAKDATDTLRATIAVYEAARTGGRVVIG